MIYVNILLIYRIVYRILLCKLTLSTYLKINFGCSKKLSLILLLTLVEPEIDQCSHKVILMWYFGQNIYVHCRCGLRGL